MIYSQSWRFQNIYTVDSLYLEHPLSRTSLYLELKSQSLCVSCNIFFSLYFEVSLSRTNFLVPCEFEIERVNCTHKQCPYQWQTVLTCSQVVLVSMLFQYERRLRGMFLCWKRFVSMVITHSMVRPIGASKIKAHNTLLVVTTIQHLFLFAAKFDQSLSIIKWIKTDYWVSLGD